jgi:hypothetical protein
MTVEQKVREICRKFDIRFYVRESYELFLFKNLIIIHEFFPAIDFKTFYLNTIKSPVNYLYEKSLLIEDKKLDLHLLSNCFNDNKNHFGIKYKDKWFFLTHTKTDFSLSINSYEFDTKNKDVVGQTYLISYSTTKPNIVKNNVGFISVNVLEKYIKKYL